MDIIINGAGGRMGRALQAMAAQKDIAVVAAVDPFVPEMLPALKQYEGSADCILDFSNHAGTKALCDYAVAAKTPVVVATTGHTQEELEQIQTAAKTVPVFWSGNMSVGIALLTKLAKQTAAMFPDADVEIVESHHNQKLDVPSGTALMLARAVQEARPEAELLVGRHENGKREKKQIGIHSLRMVKKFYDAGGKVLATGELPFRAYEFNPDDRVLNNYDDEAAEIIEDMFGIRQGEIDEFRISYECTNDAGGQAIYLLSCQAAADGTNSVDSPLIRQALQSFDIPFDVVADDMPRIPDSSIMSLPLPMMTHFHPEDTVGGVFNYLHRKLAGCDVYFFANTTNRVYDSTINLRGHFTQCEEWDPHTGKTHKLTVKHYSMLGEDYSTVSIKLPSSRSTFIIART